MPVNTAQNAVRCGQESCKKSHMRPNATPSRPDVSTPRDVAADSEFERLNGFKDKKAGVRTAGGTVLHRADRLQL